MTRTELLAVAKPILFNTEMVKAILDNNKTVTRRVVKKTHVDDVLNSQVRIGNLDISDDKFINCLCDAPYQKGDVLYVRETWRIDSIDDKTKEMLINFEAMQNNYSIMQIDCRFSSERYIKFRKFYQKKGWQPSLFMPKEVARIFLRVTDVRVEHLQNIDPSQCVCEGVTWHEYPCVWTHEAKPAFIKLWDNTIEKADLDTYGWNANPWVWVIEFERVMED